jgi:hypothetical protein
MDQQITDMRARIARLQARNADSLDRARDVIARARTVREGHGVSGYATTGTGGGAYQIQHPAQYTQIPTTPTTGSGYAAYQGQNQGDLYTPRQDSSVNAMSGISSTPQTSDYSSRPAPIPVDRVVQRDILNELLGEDVVDAISPHSNFAREQLNQEEAQEDFVVSTPSDLDRSSQAAHGVHTGSRAPSLVSDGLGRGDFSIHSYSYASSENGSLSTHEQPDTIVSQQSQVRVQNGSGYQNTMLNPTTHDPAMVMNPSAPFGQSLAGKTIWRIKQTVPQTNNNATGTHPAHTGEEGPPIQHDGSWLYDIVPQYIPTLADLPQAADQPVRTWGPGIVSNVTPAQGAYQNSRHRHAGIAVEG